MSWSLLAIMPSSQHTDGEAPLSTCKECPGQCVMVKKMVNEIRQSLWTDLQTEGPLAHQHSALFCTFHHSKKEAALEVEGVCSLTPLYHHRGPPQTLAVAVSALWCWECLEVLMISTWASFALSQLHLPPPPHSHHYSCHQHPYGKEVWTAFGGVDGPGWCGGFQASKCAISGYSLIRWWYK